MSDRLVFREVEGFDMAQAAVNMFDLAGDETFIITHPERETTEECIFIQPGNRGVMLNKVQAKQLARLLLSFANTGKIDNVGINFANNDPEAWARDRSMLTRETSNG